MRLYYSIDSTSISGTNMTIIGSIYGQGGVLASGLSFVYGLGDAKEIDVSIIDQFESVVLPGVTRSDADIRYLIGQGLPNSFTVKRVSNTHIGV